jgi:hypothetical protein
MILSTGNRMFSVLVEWWKMIEARRSDMYVCDFPVGEGDMDRCRQPLRDGQPNCGRHGTSLSAAQLGADPFILVDSDGVLHAWRDGGPRNGNDKFCVIHDDVAYKLAFSSSPERETCLGYAVTIRDEDGLRHRDNGPAKIYATGEVQWWSHGKMHRDDGPAKVYSDGSEEWWWQGKLVSQEEYAALASRICEAS